MSPTSPDSQDPARTLLGFFNRAKRGYSIDELAAAGPFSKSHIYKEIKNRRLVARKSGGRTVILPDDWERFLQALPVLGADEPIVEPRMLRGTQRKRDDAAA